MNQELQKMIAEYEACLNPGTSTTKLVDFFGLLFNADEVIQIKDVKNVHPADALYVKASEVSAHVESVYGAFSNDGYSFCCGPVPSAFMEQVDRIFQYEATCKTQFALMAKDLRDELRLVSDLFPYARTLFIEADKDADGNPLDTIEAKRIALSKILETGIPLSFITDTGGNAPHIGIIFAENLSPQDFREAVKQILSRLPPWVDTAVGKINQLGRIPGTFRINKRGEKAPVTLLYLGSRVSKRSVDEWVNSNPVTNSTILENRSTYVESEEADVTDSTDTEQAAWNFISEHGLKHSRSIKGKKIQVGCPKRDNHKGGDRNMSAFINVETGQVWCSACQETVGQTFKGNRRGSHRQREALATLRNKTAIAAAKIKKLF